jgi:hypothetical protein
MYVADARTGEMQTASIVAAKAIKIAPLHFFRMLLLTFIIPAPLFPQKCPRPLLLPRRRLTPQACVHEYVCRM